jgi:hypothetical protein
VDARNFHATLLSVQLQYPRDFWSRVNKNGPIRCADLGPCWEWLGRPDRQGYGRLTKSGLMAHRYAWGLERGPIAPGGHYGTMCVLHKCDNPLCVRVDHLFLGTHSDNMRDMWTKGRRPSLRGIGVAAGYRSCGEQRSYAKLTDAKVRSMRAEHASGVSTIQLGKMYGVSQCTAHRIVKRLAWSHVA